MEPTSASRPLPDVVSPGDVCMLTTVSGAGSLSCRPLTAAQVTDGSISFLIDRTVDWTADLVAGEQVGLSVVSSGGHNDWACLSGTATMTSDPLVIESMWAPAAEAYFTGKDDPRIGALDVVVTQGEFWSAPGGGPIGRLLAMVSAALGRPDAFNAKGDVETAGLGQD